MKLTRLAFRNLRRHRRSFAFSTVGIVLGVSSFVIFLGLGQGLRVNVLEEVFVFDQVEVVPRRYDMGAVEVQGSLFGDSTGLDDYTLQDLAALDGVSAVYPKMQLAFPSMAAGGESLFGSSFRIEFAAEGMPAELIRNDLPEPPDESFAFRDWDIDRDLPRPCLPPNERVGMDGGCPEGLACGNDGWCQGHPFSCDAPGGEGLGSQVGCPPGRFCSTGGVCERQACNPAEEVLASPHRRAIQLAKDFLNQTNRRYRPTIREITPPEDETAAEALADSPTLAPGFRLAVSSRYTPDVRRVLPGFIVRFEAQERMRLALHQGTRAAHREAGGRHRRRTPVVRDVTLLDGDLGACMDPPSYCSQDTRRCEMPIPVVASPFLMELYNTVIQNVLSGSDKDMPAVTPEMLMGFVFEVQLGHGMLGRAANLEEEGVGYRAFRMVGWTQRAMRLGVTAPFTAIQRINSRYVNPESGRQFHSVLVVAEGSDDLASIVERIEAEPDEGGLGLAIGSEYQEAKRYGLLINLLTVGLLFISALIIGLASLNIGHTFLMIVAERRRELGVLRSVGARRSNIMALVLGEATVIGTIGASLGVGLALGASILADRFLDCRVPDWAGMQALCIPDFPFKPDSFFLFENWILLAGFAIAIVFSVLGALVPAFRASRVDPAEALRSH